MMRRWQQSHRLLGTRGFTIYDALIGVAVLSVGLFTLLNSLAGMGQRQVFAESMLNASMMAQAVMDQAIAKGFTNVNSLAGTNLTYDATYYPNYTYDLNVVYVNLSDLNTAVAGPTDYKRVEVIGYHAIGGSVKKRALLRTILNSGV